MKTKMSIEEKNKRKRDQRASVMITKIVLMRQGKVQMMSKEEEREKNAPIAKTMITTVKEDIVIEIETTKKMVVREKRAVKRGRKVAEIVDMKTREMVVTTKRRERGVVIAMVIGIRSALAVNADQGKIENDIQLARELVFGRQKMDVKSYHP